MQQGAKVIQGFKVLRAADPINIGASKPLTLSQEPLQVRAFDNAAGGLRRFSSAAEIRAVAEKSATNLVGVLSKDEQV